MSYWSHWNYRVVRDTAGLLTIREVYYEDGAPRAVTLEGVKAAASSKRLLHKELCLMLGALLKPVLEEEDIK